MARNIAGHFTVQTSARPLEARAVILAHGLAQLGDISRAAPDKLLRRAYVNFKAHFAACDLPPATIAIAGASGMYAGLTEANRE